MRIENSVKAAIRSLLSRHRVIDCNGGLGKGTWKALWSPLCMISDTYTTGRKRKEDSKPCVTSVIIILFEITFCQAINLPLNKSFCKRPENFNVNGRS